MRSSTYMNGHWTLAIVIRLSGEKKKIKTRDGYCVLLSLGRRLPAGPYKTTTVYRMAKEIRHVVKCLVFTRSVYFIIIILNCYYCFAVVSNFVPSDDTTDVVWTPFPRPSEPPALPRSAPSRHRRIPSANYVFVDFFFPPSYLRPGVPWLDFVVSIKTRVRQTVSLPPPRRSAM